jgi:hypothetical protein
MAAEMSTGVLAMAHTYGLTPAVSMLIVKTEGTFLKKATGLTTFICEDGHAIQHIVKETISSGKSSTIHTRSVGKNKEGEVVAEFVFTWSFKTRS